MFPPQNRRAMLVSAVICGLLLAIETPASAQTPEPGAARAPAPAAATAPAAAAPAGPGPAQPAEPPAAVDGFRSAHFGMTEAQLRQAIREDFPMVAARLSIAVHPTEKTTVLGLIVPELLPGTGPARVSYILGYRTKRLIQVNVNWTSEGSGPSRAAVLGGANLLRNYFTAENFKPENTVTNRQLAGNAILVFRGIDQQGHMVVLVLNGAESETAAGSNAAHHPPATLELSYIADPMHPDAYTAASPAPAKRR